MKVHFCRSEDIGGLLIRLLTFSRWNHVGVEIDGAVYESVTSGGVRKISAHGFARNWSQTEYVSVNAPHPEKARAFLERQIDKPYDWAAILALPFRKHWQNPGRWFCSELAAAALIEAGFDATPRVKPHRITPRDLWIALPG